MWWATWQRPGGRGAHILGCIRGLGFKAGLCAQDGWTDAPVDWAAFDALFVGGTDAFKLAESTYALVAEAKQRGKWCHMGRVNSQRRFNAARVGGYDSVDGTFLCFGPDKNWPLLLQWLDANERQRGLFGEALA